MTYQVLADEYGIDLQKSLDKKTGMYTIPAYIVAITKLAKQLEPIGKNLIAVAGKYGYTPESVVEAIADLTYEFNDVNFADFWSTIGGEFYYTDSRQLELFTNEGEAISPLEDNGLTKPAE
jgi:hypothetical protein